MDSNELLKKFLSNFYEWSIDKHKRIIHIDENDYPHFSPLENLLVTALYVPHDVESIQIFSGGGIMFSEIFWYESRAEQSLEEILSESKALPDTKYWNVYPHIDRNEYKRVVSFKPFIYPGTSHGMGVFFGTDDVEGNPQQYDVECIECPELKDVTCYPVNYNSNDVEDSLWKDLNKVDQQLYLTVVRLDQGKVYERF